MIGVLRNVVDLGCPGACASESIADFLHCFIIVVVRFVFVLLFASTAAAAALFTA